MRHVRALRKTSLRGDAWRWIQLKQSQASTRQVFALKPPPNLHQVISLGTATPTDIKRNPGTNAPAQRRIHPPAALRCRIAGSVSAKTPHLRRSSCHGASGNRTGALPSSVRRKFCIKDAQSCSPSAASGACCGLSRSPLAAMRCHRYRDGRQD
jgi:hypothetical protein